MDATRWPTTWSSTSPGRRCPSCGEQAGRPILRGMPTDEVMDAIEAGEIDIALGGCCTGENDPTHECSGCGAEFGGRSRQDAVDDLIGKDAGTGPTTDELRAQEREQDDERERRRGT